MLLQKVLDLLQAILGGEKQTPLAAQQQLGGGLYPHNSTSTASERKGGKKGVQHCAAGQFSLFLGRQRSAVAFLLLQHAYDFIGAMHFGPSGMRA